MTISRIVGCLVLLVVGVAGVAGGAGRSDVADAVMKGDKAALRALLQQKADVNAPQVDGATALHWAVYRDDVETRRPADWRRRQGRRGESRGRHAAGDGVALRQPADDRRAAQGRRRREAARAERRDDADARGAQRQPAGDQAADRSRRRREREGEPARHDGADVGGRTEASRGGEGAARARRRLQREVGPAGLPRNYMAPRVNTAAVEQAAAPLRARQPPPGRTYEEQLEWEAAHGAKISHGRSAAR